MRDWKEDQDVVVNYPNGPAKPGVIARCFSDRTYCVIFSQEGRPGAEAADPHVPERYLTIPGVHMDATAPE